MAHGEEIEYCEKCGSILEGTYECQNCGELTEEGRLFYNSKEEDEE